MIRIFCLLNIQHLTGHKIPSPGRAKIVLYFDLYTIGTLCTNSTHALFNSRHKYLYYLYFYIKRVKFK